MTDGPADGLVDRPADGLANGPADEVTDALTEAVGASEGVER